MHFDERSCACTLWQNPFSSFSSRARAHVYVSYRREGNPGVRGGKTERERGRSDYRARASGCPRRVRPDRPSSPSCNPPGFTFPGTRPPGDYRWISVRRYSRNAAPSCRDTLEVGPRPGPVTTSGGFKDLCHFYIKRVLILPQRPTFATSQR